MPIYFSQLNTGDINSFSAALMLGTTLYRNQIGGPNYGHLIYRIGAQFGYGLTTVIATVETTVALIFLALSVLILPFSSTLFPHAFSWLSSSLFCILWSIIDFILNPLTSQLVADEQSARLMFAQNNALHIPPNALI